MKWNIESYILEKDNSRNKIFDLFKKNILNIKNYDKIRFIIIGEYIILSLLKRDNHLCIFHDIFILQ